MIEFFNNVWSGVQATSIWEWLAVATSILYVIFAARKMMVCWTFALITSGLYIYICFISQLYIETILQFFYLAMAVVGWVMWKKSNNLRLDMQQWSLTKHLINIIVSGLVALLLGYLFDVYTNQANPYVDAFTTCYSLAATFMVTKKVVENWLYWIVIDAVSIYLYAGRELQLTAILFLIFTILAIFGYASWRKEFKRQRT